jgi:hypothetical protein
MLRLCDLVWIQTRNLLIRSQMLYSVELRSHSHYWDCKCSKLSFKKQNFRTPLNEKS